MTPSHEFVRLGLSDPERLISLTLSQWDLLIPQARNAAVLGRIHFLLEQNGLLHRVPESPRMHLEAARTVAANQERVVQWEAYCIQRALRGIDTDVVMLKGSAYILAELPIAKGRLQSDIDILVPKPKLQDVEAALMKHGWQSMKLKKYDQQYYRKWAHELPPLYHPERGTIIDVHHNILPLTNRLHPSAEKLLQAAQPIPGTCYKRLCAEDMLLHTSAHMFQDGTLELGLRELGDIDGLIRHFGGPAEFWQRLLERAPALDLQRPLFYALRYAKSFLKTPVPDAVISASAAWQPNGLVLGGMDRLVAIALAPKPSPETNPGAALSRWLLYTRSHWLRMPPVLLARHLMHQGFSRLFAH